MDRVDEQLAFGINRAARQVMLAGKGLECVRPQFVERGKAGVFAAVVGDYRDYVFPERAPESVGDGGLGLVYQVGVADV